MIQSWKDTIFRYSCLVVPLLFAALYEFVFIRLPDSLQLPFALIGLVIILGLNVLRRYLERRALLFLKLSNAAHSGTPEELATLLKLGVPSKPLPKSQTLVWLLKGAVLRRNEEMMKIVLNAGADWDEKDFLGISSKEFAEMSGVDIDGLNG